ncbi:short chain dehydrogenase/reductase family oxidoreductase (plasmid) [Legionella adelaidensis]|uniref:Short chain dehydrogenase/reductase family oxidoreductase n=1 Tax=Legionella adelaidensis TaxID=45056 RepID=A0A0W0R110_9GAMM|nr:SDR family oxidoreductase [Legionella adelaidensis]KTC64780.1 short chain dehydrogenase/reductase family oxidoreductase [Legionella adelaidensis]VEH82685.1 short chain dehydrogenase/reductase family oxidoreductase [Legionella adelaidensis]
MELKNKTVLITGASSGIGKACAELFAQKSANLLLCARRQERLQELKSTLQEKYKIDVHTFALDVRNKNKVFTAFKSLPGNWQNIDVLINNAGLAAGLENFQEADIEDWEAMIDTNVKGLLYVSKAVLPQMLERNTGHIINLGSIAGHQVYPKGSVYCASKHAVKAISQGLRMDLLGTKIRVSSIDPGAVETEFSLVRFKGDQQRADNVYQGMTPLNPEDIAQAIYFCVSCPAHVNISEMIIMPTDQAAAGMTHRKK